MISVDWTLNNNRSKPFYQPKTEVYPPAGKTTKDADHIHQYNVDEYGNGWALEHKHLQDSRIKHKHKIVNWVVEESQSNCYPQCEAQFGKRGSPPHIHILDEPKIQKFPERYSVTVISDYLNTGGQLLQDRMNSCTGSGIQRILNYYSRKPNSSVLNSVLTEEYYVSERPGAKMKVLISLPSNTVDGLEYKDAPTINRTGLKEININTFGIDEKIISANSFLIKYFGEIKKFQGKIFGLDSDRLSTSLLGVIPALSNLMLENEIEFSSAKSTLITLFTDSEYKVLSVRFNDGARPVLANKGLDTFLENRNIQDKRAIYLLSKLDKIDDIHSNNTPISWTSFLKDYILNPPEFQFGEQFPQSTNVAPATNEKLNKDNQSPVKTEEDVVKFKEWVEEPSNLQDLDKNLATVSDFVGDEIIGNIKNLSEIAHDVDSLFSEILNATGLDELIKSALHCVNVDTEFGIGELNDDLLRSTTQLLTDVQSVFFLPTLEIEGQNPEIVDFIQGIATQMWEGIKQAALVTIVTMVQDLLKMIFNFCTECSVRSEDGSVKTYNQYNFGATGWGGFLGSAFSSGPAWAALGNRATAGVLQGFNQTRYLGDYDAFAENVLKNSTQHIDRLLDDEVDRTWEEIQATILSYTDGSNLSNARQNIERAKESSLVVEWRTRLNLSSGQTLTKKGIKDWLKNQEGSPWKTHAFKQASKEYTEWMNASLTAFTPGELGNALLGCQISDDAKEIGRNSIQNYPALCLAICGDSPEQTDDNIANCYAMAGKLLGQDPILTAIADLADDVPGELKCLDDINYDELRETLLRTKDSSMTPEEIAEQVRKAKERNRKRVNELLGLLGKKSSWDNLSPQLYCTASSDGTIIPGILSLDSPIKQAATKKTLDTIYDSLKMTFNENATSFIPALGTRTIDRVVVPRTIEVDIDSAWEFFTEGTSKVIINPDFEELVQKGLYSYGSLPNGATIPNTRKQPSGSIFGALFGWDSMPRGDPIKYNSILSIVNDSWNNCQGVGMWEEGATRPTGEQELEWKEANETWGGRSFESTDDSDQNLGPGQTMMDYVLKYGNSPIPAYKNIEGDINFLPGLKEVYKTMCSNSELFQINLGTNDNKYKLGVPNNLIEESGVDLNNILLSLDNIGNFGSIINSVKGSNVSEYDVQALTLNFRESINALKASKFRIIYNVPGISPASTLLTQPTKDKYTVVFEIESSAQNSPVSFPGPISIQPIKPTVQKAIFNNNLQVKFRTSTRSDEKVQPQEGYFYDLCSKIWGQHIPLYRNGVKSLDIAPASTRMEILTPAGRDQFVDNILYNLSSTPEKGAYEELYNDLFCSLTVQISESPYMNYKPDDSGFGMANVNLVPPRYQGQPNSCHKTLLDIDLIKQQIMMEYDLTKCINRFFRDPNDMPSNKNSPFEIANRSGAILLIIRSFALEFLLKSLASFHYFAPNAPEDVDSVVIYQLYNKMHQELPNLAIGTDFYKSFQKETIELYNRNRPKDQQLDFTVNSAGIQYNKYEKALKYMIRYQVFSVSKRLSDFAKGQGDLSPHSILMEKWLPAVEPPINDIEPRFANEDGGNKVLKSFDEVAGVVEITQEMQAARMGTLSTNGINQIVGVMEGANLHAGHAAQLGTLIKSWFKPDKRLEQFKNLNTQNILKLTDEIWPAITSPCYYKRRSMGGYQREVSCLELIADNPVWRYGISNPEINAGSKIIRFLKASQFWTGDSTPKAGAQGDHTWGRFYDWVFDDVNNTTGNILAKRVSSGRGNSYPPAWEPPVFSPASSGTDPDWASAPVVKKAAQPFWARTYATHDFSSHGTGRLGTTDEAATQDASHYDKEGMLYNRLLDDCDAEPDPERTMQKLRSQQRAFFDYQGNSVNKYHGRLAIYPDFKYHGPGSILKALTQWQTGFLGRVQAGPGYGIAFKSYKKDTTGNYAGYIIGPYYPDSIQSSQSEDKRIALKKRDYEGYYVDESGQRAASSGETLSFLEALAKGLSNLGVGVKSTAFPIHPVSSPLSSDWYHRAGDAQNFGGFEGSGDDRHVKVGQPRGSKEALADRLIKPFSGTERARYRSHLISLFTRHQWGEIQYLSLLDFPLKVIPEVLKYERYICTILRDLSANQSDADLAVLGLSRAELLGSVGGHEGRLAVSGADDTAFYESLVLKYSDWITEFEEIVAELTETRSQRECLKTSLDGIIQSGREPRNEMIIPKMYDIGNGNIFLEPYIRIEDYSGNESFIDEIRNNVDYVKDSTSSGRSDYTRGVVNIDKWGDWMMSAFDGNEPKDKLPGSRYSGGGDCNDHVLCADCGEDLPSCRPTIISIDGILPEPQLIDYFKKISYGVRICYLPSPDDFVDPANLPTDTLFDVNKTADADSVAALEKTFYVKERATFSTGGTKERVLHPFPLCSVETPIDMMVTIADAITFTDEQQIETQAEMNERCAGDPVAPPPSIRVNYFRSLFGSVVTPGIEAPRDYLRRQMIATEEYNFLFKYCFPVDRMISLSQIYNSVYLSTLPNLENVFTPTKHELIRIFLRSLKSGDWKNACEIGNADIMNAAINGIPIPWAAVLSLIVKWPLNVYKAFVEQSDMNVAMSKNIQNVIKAVNKTMVTMQMQAKALQQAAGTAWNQIEAATQYDITKEDCGFGIDTPEALKAPYPDGQIKDNLIPVPETWMIGLLLFPPQIWGPWTAPFGVPIGPHTIPYWILDDQLVPIDWFNAFPDWLNNLAREPERPALDPGDDDCPLDFGVPEFNDRYGGNNNGGNNNSGG